MRNVSSCLITDMIAEIRKENRENTEISITTTAMA